MRRHSGRLRIQLTRRSALVTVFIDPDSRDLPFKQFIRDFILTFEELSVFSI